MHERHLEVTTETIAGKLGGIVKIDGTSSVGPDHMTFDHKLINVKWLNFFP